MDNNVYAKYFQDKSPLPVMYAEKNKALVHVKQAISDFESLP
jgi:hypothetical protein